MNTVYIILPMLVFTSSLFLTGLVLKSEFKSSLHRLFAAFLIAMSIWGLTIFGMRSSRDLATAYKWEKAALIAIVFTSVLFYHFALRLSHRRTGGITLRLFYGMAIAVSILSLTGYVASGMQDRFYGHAPILGLSFPLYLLTSYLPIALALVVLRRTSRESWSSDERNRIRYVILGAAGSLVGGTTDFLPALGVPIYPLGIVMNLVFVALTTVAMVRFRLMDLRLVLRRGFAYSIISTAIFAAYGVIFLLFSLILQNHVTGALVIATIGALLIVTVFLPPAVGRIQQFVDRLFFRQQYDHLVALQQFTQETRDIADFQGLANSLIRTSSLAMSTDWVALLVPQPESGDFAVTASAGAAPELAFKGTATVAKWLSSRNRVATRLDFALDPYLQAMGDTLREGLLNAGVELLVPLKAKDQLTGILALGPKLTNSDYSAADIELLSTVASQAAVVIENSRLYSQEMARIGELEALSNLKSNLLRTVSHELKSPITAVRASADLLGTQEGLGEEQKQRLFRVLQNGLDRLERLVQESLDYAQMKSVQLDLQLVPTDMLSLVNELAMLISPLAKTKNQQLIVDVPEALPEMLIDRQRVERILINLLSNANKFTPLGGVISVKVHEVGNDLAVEVSDTGPGIPESDQKFLFTEYYRGSNADGQRNSGTGLGLSIAKYLVELHGGRIGVRSKPSSGTTFWFTLPIVPASDVESLP